MDLKKYTTLFLDRDGVINHKIDGYVQYFGELNFIDGVLEVFPTLTDYFDRILIVTNQQGIGKGLMTDNDLLILHNQMKVKIENFGGRIDKIYFCPHMEEEKCNCRKPQPGMLIQAKSDFPEIDFERSILIGDSDTDILAAKNVNVDSVQVSPEYTLSMWANKFLSD
tara:strand:- start:411 stop:911 length:501 start_codon:yes stop_codon:yes gene_type:complete